MILILGFIVLFASCSQCDSLVGVVDIEILGVDSTTDVEIVKEETFQYFVIEAGMETFHDGKEGSEKLYRNGMDLRMTAIEFENAETGEKKWFRREYERSRWECETANVEFLPHEDVEILTPLTFGMCNHKGRFQDDTCAWKIGIKFPYEGRITGWVDVESISTEPCGELERSEFVFDIKIYGSDENYNIIYRDFEGELADKESLINELEASIDYLRGDDNGDLEGRLVKLESRLTEYEGKIQEMELKNSELGFTNEDLRDVIEDDVERITELEGKILRLKSSVEELEIANSEYRKLINDCDYRLNEKNNDCDREEAELKVQVDILEHKVSDILDEYCPLVEYSTFC